jgi:uncharacterized protein (DUF427 family)
MSEHIKIHKATGKWVVRTPGAVIAETCNALELSESGHKPVIYFPRGDIAMAFLDQSAQSSHCPHKGDAGYFSIHTKSTVLENSAWSYEDPSDAVAQIKSYLAFDKAQVTVEEL